MDRILLIPCAAAMLCAAAPLGAPGDHASVKMTGRAAEIALPYRTSGHLIWVSATTSSKASPFAFKSLAIRPHAGPNGADLAVFTYVADRPGSTTLEFGLVPPGKMLTGPPTLIYRGPVARRVAIKITAK
jgi:hypothetical protein